MSIYDGAGFFSKLLTASVLGGGSLAWGTWSFRATPIDFRLRTHFHELRQLEQMEDKWRYSIPDWPISYSEIEPFYNVAESLLSVCGNRAAITRDIEASAWFQAWKNMQHFQDAGSWESTFDFPFKAFPQTPVGSFFHQAFERAGYKPFQLPSGMVRPGAGPFRTRDAIAASLAKWGNEPKPGFWKRSPEGIWSERIRDACNMCGYCGGYLCWGSTGPKSGTRFSTIRELEDLPNAEVRVHAKAIEVLYDGQSRRAKGVKFLDLTDPDDPRIEIATASNVIVSCGAVQSARLLFMSGPPGGLGNRYDQLGRNVTFHTFDLLATVYLREELQGYLHGEIAHTGNTATFANYFVEDKKGHQIAGVNTKGWWSKCGTMVSTAKHNPLEDAMRKVKKGGKLGVDLLQEISRHARKMQLRLTGDDLPMRDNRVDLDPTHVDEYGLPVARITRDYGPHELWMGELMDAQFRAILKTHLDSGLLDSEKPGDSRIEVKRGTVDLIGDHQHGTCRMGDDPKNSVLDRFCRVHDVKNLFVVDTSCFPTGFGLNPMVTVVANALRVGSWIAEQSRKGSEL